jgi:hemoglobin
LTKRRCRSKEEIFDDRVLADPILRALFKERRPHHVEHLTWFTAESFGGPDRFTRNLGFQHLIDVHRHLEITDEQRERFVEL